MCTAAVLWPPHLRNISAKDGFHLNSVNVSSQSKFTDNECALALLDLANTTSEIFPNMSTKIISNTTLGIFPQMSTNVFPNLTSEIFPNMTSEVSPNTNSEIFSNRTSEIFSNTTSEIFSHTTSEILSNFNIPSWFYCSETELNTWEHNEDACTMSDVHDHLSSKPNVDEVLCIPFDDWKSVEKTQAKPKQRRKSSEPYHRLYIKDEGPSAVVMLDHSYACCRASKTLLECEASDIERGYRKFLNNRSKNDGTLRKRARRIEFEDGKFLFYRQNFKRLLSLSEVRNGGNSEIDHSLYPRSPKQRWMLNSGEIGSVCCHLCHKSFNKKQYLIRHLRQMHEIRDPTCHKCNKQFHLCCCIHNFQNHDQQLVPLKNATLGELKPDWQEWGISDAQWASATSSLSTHSVASS